VSDWQAALDEAAELIAGRVVRGRDTWIAEPAGSGPATVGLFVGDGTLRMVAVRDAGAAGWRFVGGSLRPLWTWRELLARCLVCYGRESPLAMLAVESWGSAPCST
jgi:hypothetical protein